MFGKEVVTVPVSDAQPMAVKAEQFVVEKYRLCVEKSIGNTRLYSGGRIHDVKALENYMIHELVRVLSPYITISEPYYLGHASCRVKATVDLAYIRDKEVAALERKIGYLESVEVSHLATMAYYREEIAKLEEVIIDISRPWYERLADWWSRP